MHLRRPAASMSAGCDAQHPQHRVQSPAPQPGSRGGAVRAAPSKRRAFVCSCNRRPGDGVLPHEALLWFGTLRAPPAPSEVPRMPTRRSLQLWAAAASLSTATSVVFGAPPDAGGRSSPRTEEYSAAGIRTVSVDLRCGQVVIERGAETTIQAELRVRCDHSWDRCEERAEKLALSG